MEEPLFVDLREHDMDDETREIQRRNADRARADKDIRDTILTVYRTVWTEFYEWEPRGCLPQLQSLIAHFPGAYDPNVFTPLGGFVDDMAVDDGSSSMTLLISDLIHVWEVTVSCADDSASSIAPHPKYEACTPAIHNIKTDERRDFLRFIQYAGEPGFDEKALMEESRVAWQDRWQDPDVGLIAMDTVRRLEDLALSYNTIDRFGILPQLTSNGKNGLFWRMSQRDLWPWESSRGPSETQRMPILYNDLGLFPEVNEITDLFCPNMSCVQVLCLTHKEPTAPFAEKLPHVKNAAMIQKSQDSCSEDCYILHMDDNTNPVELPDASAIQVIHDVLKLFPDELPCTLAKICQVACYQIYLQRSEFFSDEDIYPEVRQAVQTNVPLHFEDDRIRDRSELIPIDFCVHEGPCNKQSGCICSESKISCRRNCRCDFKCKLRFKGCKCKNNKCSPATCICFKINGECDPELCTYSFKNKKKVSNKRKSRHHCHNMELQLCQYPCLMIKSGKHGLGTFAVRAISKRTSVGEYIAELFADNELEGLITTHRDLNYAFTLNEGQVLDAAHIGNETRYINHSSAKRANTTAEIKWVNGDHHIKFFTVKRVKCGEELLFDYGDAYWHGNPPPDTA